MLVKAKWSVKDASGWHNAGEVFTTEQDMGDAVEVLDAPKAAVQLPEPDMEPENVPEAAKPETEPEPEAKAERPRGNRNGARRKAVK